MSKPCMEDDYLYIIYFLLSSVPHYCDIKRSPFTYKSIDIIFYFIHNPSITKTYCFKIKGYPWVLFVNPSAFK